jgi:bacillithiol biosynthesis cysteine-adding enzyme BshC
MKVESVCLPLQDRLFAAYCEWRGPVRQFYVRSPFKGESYPERAARLDEIFVRADRRELVQALLAWHEPELLHPEVARNLKRLTLPDSLVVIGGQQAGLLGGPLYTIHKAITLVQLARREERRLGRPVIPVFWIAGEDHDHEEVNHVWVPTADAVVRKHRYSAGGKPGQPVSHLNIEADRFHLWLDELAGMLPDSPFKPEWLQLLKAFSGDSPSWTRLFARVMHHLFGKWGLVLIDAADPAIRRLEAPFFRELIVKSEKIASHVVKAADRFREWGFGSPVEVHANQGHLFLLQEGRRLLMVRESGMWVVKDGSLVLTEEELLRIAEQEPERLSTNVITRPLMQEYLFPVLAFVGGPAEVAYWGLLRDAFGETGLEMPIVVPRLQFTLLDRTSAKRAQDFGLDTEALLTRLQEEQAEWLRRHEPLDADAFFDQAWGRIRETHEELVSQLDRGLGMNLREMGEKNLSKIRIQLEYFRKFTQRAIRQKHGAALKRWANLEQWVRPFGKFQERIHCVIPFWNMVGLEWLDRLAELPAPDESEPFRHQVVLL